MSQVCVQDRCEGTSWLAAHTTARGEVAVSLFRFRRVLVGGRDHGSALSVAPVVLKGRGCGGSQGVPRGDAPEVLTLGLCRLV